MQVKYKGKDMVRKSGGEVVAYYQVVAKDEVEGEKVDRPQERIVEDALKFVPEIKNAFNLMP
jgi:hypothetical protein